MEQAIYYTIKWTNTQTGETAYPAKPAQMTRENALAWISNGSVEGWKGELVEWSEYEKEQKALESEFIRG